MNFVALVSGGKDSIYALCKLIDQGYTLIGLLHMKGNDKYNDSYMFQTVGSEFLEHISECLGVPLLIKETACNANNKDLIYKETIGDEVEDLYLALKQLRESLDFEYVSSGAILSRYQKNRVEEVCKRLSLKSLAPLWTRDQRELLTKMINSGIDARIIKIASPMLSKECIGMNLREVLEYFDVIGRTSKAYEINYCGEGGEYETIVVDCKYYKRRILLENQTIFPHPEEAEKDDGCVFFSTFSNIKTIEK